MNDNKTISRIDLAAALQGPNPPVLFEALPLRYWVDGHLPGAVALPPDELTPRLAALALDRTKPVVVYCASSTCANSHQVATKMAQLGYADVRVYEGGKADWVDAGLGLDRAVAG
ncbi:MAG TPA: rhodanese-like domain-containing protein [Kofleriaceae bacterium]|nr:rhodanese-like domain-containing protein [Kofleriaceae bacterium]